MGRLFYLNFLGFLIKKGKKEKAKKILHDAFYEVSLKLKEPVHILLLRVFIRLNVFIETKKIKFKRGTHVVPFVIGSFKRKTYLIVKWIMISIKDDKRKVPLAQKLAKEIIEIIEGKSAKTLSQKELNLKNALSNRSNIHFRW